MPSLIKLNHGWSEVNHQQPIIDGKEILTDGTDGICEGRHECAEK